MTKVFSLLIDLVALPDFRSETWRTLRRQMSLVTYHPVSEFLAMVVEPIFLLTVLGWGLGFWLKEIDGRAYPQFVAPAVAVLTCVFVPYWEIAFGVFARLKQGSGYWVALQGPINANDLGNGEILWATMKGTLASMVVLAFAWLMGWIPSKLIFLAPVALLPGALLSAAFGLWCAANFNSPSKLVLVQGIVLGPIALWSDTIFPFSRSGVTAEWLVFFSPVAHLVHTVRMLSTAEINADFFLSLAVLWGIACIAANYAVMSFSRKLVPS